MDQFARHFEVTLIGHYWDLIPEYAIYCNTRLICRRAIPTRTGIAYTEHFDHVGDEPVTLRINFENKMSDQSVLNLDRTRLIRDMLLEVHSIKVDDRPVGVEANSLYTLDQKNIYNGQLVKEIAHINVMGYNGVLTINIP
jgi:hypothetical protein